MSYEIRPFEYTFIAEERRADNDQDEILEDIDETVEDKVEDKELDEITVSPCVVCYERRPNVFFTPCNHLKVCKECWKEHIDKVGNRKCVYCNTPVEQAHHVYL